MFVPDISFEDKIQYTQHTMVMFCVNVLDRHVMLVPSSGLTLQLPGLPTSARPGERPFDIVVDCLD